MNLTLVGYYGAKADSLRKFIKNAQKVLGHALPSAFEKYDVRQVHGTIIGLEGTRLGEYIINQNYFEQRRLLKAVNLPKLFQMLKASEHLPFRVRVGGYKHRKKYPFTSRGQHPYLRSFSVQGDVVVAMGWPEQGSHYPPTLHELRWSLNAANVLHKYHSSPADFDNDFFFVLGRINRAKASELDIQVAQEKMRIYFEKQKGYSVTIDSNSLRVVAYNDTKLPWGGCQVFTLAEAEASVPELFMMYDDPAA
jgi:hypothetical protein